MPDARELFTNPTPPPVAPPEPVAAPPEPVAPVSQPVPVETPVVPQPTAPPEPQQDHWGKVLNETMAALNIIDPTGGLTDQVRQVRREGIPYYPPRQPNGQFAPQPAQPQTPPAEPQQQRYVGELTTDEYEALQQRVYNSVQERAQYDAAIREEHRQCREKLDALTAPRQTWDEAGKPVFVPAIPKQELEAAEREALKYRIDTGQPGGAAAYTRLVLQLWNVNRLTKPNGGLQVAPNPVANQVAVPAAGSPAMPQGKSTEQIRREKLVEGMLSAGRPSARQLFSK